MKKKSQRKRRSFLFFFLLQRNSQRGSATNIYLSLLIEWCDVIQRQHEEKQKGKEKVGEDSVNSRVWFGLVQWCMCAWMFMLVKCRLMFLPSVQQILYGDLS